jgi:hypothetical protein
MKTKFALFQSHLDLAHSYWERLIKKGDIIIDATCGNGQDTLRLAQLCLVEEMGSLYAIDILAKAIEHTHRHLEQALEAPLLSRVHFVHACHSTFPETISPNSVQLIIYNLGYLPGGGDKSLTTKVETTLQSLRNALNLIQPGGAISLTLYPGHPEGEREEENILAFVQGLDPLQWNCCNHQWLNRRKSPRLLMLQKRIHLS